MTGDNDLVVDLIDDDETIETPVEGGQKAPEKPKKPDISASLDDLKRKLDAERARAAEAARARSEAEKRASEAIAQAKKYQDESRLDRYNTVINGFSAAQSKAESLKSQYKQALEAGEYDKAADYQMQMAVAGAELVKYQESKAILEEENKAAGATEEKKAPSSGEDKFEKYVSQFTPRSQAWLRENPEYVTDTELNFSLHAADAGARKKGLQPETDAYYAYIEERLGMKQADKADDDEAEPEAKPQAKKPPAAAPVARGNGNGSSNGGSDPQRVSLNRAEVEIAEALGMTKEEYGKFKLRAIREGRYDQPR